MRDIVTWILAVEVLGLAVLPSLRAFFGNRRDAALLSRPVGLALVGWIAWALSLATPLGFSRAAVFLAVLLVAAVSFFARRGAPKGEGPFWGKAESRGALYFWIPAAIFLLVRAAVPEILGAEKFMDLAFLSSLTRGPDMPPADPWMSGRTINYYYWGYMLTAAIAKAAGIDPLVGYNLAVATFAGFSFAAAACLGFRLSGGRTPAALGAGFVSVFAGNLTGAWDAWARPFARDFDYWHASRVIGKGDTINEFPFFTFFHADLHPHLLAFPFFIAAFAVADRVAEAGTAFVPERSRIRDFVRWAAPLLLLALVAGTAVAANLWNTPAIAILLVVAGILANLKNVSWSSMGKFAFGVLGCVITLAIAWVPAKFSVALANLIVLAISALVLANRSKLGSFTEGFFGPLLGLAIFVASLLLFRPYAASFALPYNGIAKTHAVSGLAEFLGVWGILFAVAAAALLVLASVEGEGEKRRRDLFLAAAAALSIALALGKKTPAFAPIVFLVLLACGAAWVALREKKRAPLFAAFLCVLALGIIAGCEVVHFKDSYGDKLHRMNTIFKFYHQAWPLLGIGGVVFADLAWRRATGSRRALAAVFAVAAFAAILYPSTAAVSRLRQGDGSLGLDARPALGRRNPLDLEAIEWLRRNAAAGETLIEASGDPYSEFARVSTHTGIPAVLGWANHESLWRAHEPEVMERLGQVRLFYTSRNAALAQGILRRYGVDYVVLGDLERRTYPGAEAVAAFPFLEPVPGTPAVYRVSGAR